jgi:hypothetical protein
MRRRLRRATVLAAAAFLTLTLAQAGAAQAGAAQAASAQAASDPTLVVQAPGTYYLPTRAPSGGLLFAMALNLAPVSGEEPLAKDVTLTIDAGSLAGKAAFSAVSGVCERRDLVFTCTYDSIDGLTPVQPFRIKATDAAGAGDGGTISYTATASNAPAATATTRILLGSPEFRSPRLPARGNLAPGSSVPLTPAFVNTGDVPSQGVALVLAGLPAERTYGNCHYRTGDSASAICTFPQKIAPGAAYETDAPFGLTLPRDLMYGYASYDAYALDALPDDFGFPRDYPVAGKGRKLRLKAVDGSGFTADGGRLAVTTTQHADFRAIGGAVSGAVGDTVEVTLGLKNAGPGSFALSADDGRTPGGYRITPPEGTTLVDTTDPEGDDAWPCHREEGEASYLCDVGDVTKAGDTVARALTFRIDKAVAGAKGAIEVVSGNEHPTNDPDPDNDRAAIPVSVSDSSDTGGVGGTVPVAVAATGLVALGGVAFAVMRRGRRPS